MEMSINGSAASSSGHAHRLDVAHDLEDGRAADHEHKQADQPRRRRVFVLGRLQTFGHVAPLGDVAVVHFIGHTHALFCRHFYIGRLGERFTDRIN